MASDKAPAAGRLYHHLAILARPNPLRQLCLYCKSLCVPISFRSTKESILSLFNPVWNADNRQEMRMCAGTLVYRELLSSVLFR